jgi:hypothetical protein
MSNGQIHLHSMYCSKSVKFFSPVLFFDHVLEARDIFINLVKFSCISGLASPKHNFESSKAVKLFTTSGLYLAVFP